MISLEQERGMDFYTASILGWRQITWDQQTWWAQRDFAKKWHGKFLVKDWQPSTNIEHAWHIVEQLQKKGYRVAINTTCDEGRYDIVVGNAVADMHALTFVPLCEGICQAMIWLWEYAGLQARTSGEVGNDSNT